MVLLVISLEACPILLVRLLTQLPRSWFQKPPNKVSIRSRSSNLTLTAETIDSSHLSSVINQFPKFPTDTSDSLKADQRAAAEGMFFIFSLLRQKMLTHLV